MSVVPPTAARTERVGRRAEARDVVTSNASTGSVSFDEPSPNRQNARYRRLVARLEDRWQFKGTGRVGTRGTRGGDR